MTELLAITDDAILKASDVLRLGGLVAFPTETVYGLGANALDAAAVERIFEAKGRPATNPVIVHVSDITHVSQVAASWPILAEKLATRFWPGPLTLVVPKHVRVPDIVTAHGPTVAIRCPAHPVARALIRSAGVPLAAPSANRSTELSPTRAEHVLKSLNGRIDLVLDGGPCPGGIESTVVDVTGEMARLLRPGLITVPMLEDVVGRVEVNTKTEDVARSPGQMAKHYSPRTPLFLASSWGEADELYARLQRESKRVHRLDAMPADPIRYAAALYDEFHRLDECKLDAIVAVLPPDTPEWAAIRDRLTRASA